VLDRENCLGPSRTASGWEASSGRIIFLSRVSDERKSDCCPADPLDNAQYGTTGIVSKIGAEPALSWQSAGCILVPEVCWARKEGLLIACSFGWIVWRKNLLRMPEVHGNVDGQNDRSGLVWSGCCLLNRAWPPSARPRAQQAVER